MDSRGIGDSIITKALEAFEVIKSVNATAFEINGVFWSAPQMGGHFNEA